MSRPPFDPNAPVDRADPAAVAAAGIEALIAGDHARFAELSHVPAEEREGLAAQGMTYPELLDMMLMGGGPEQYGGGTLLATLERLYVDGFEELIVGEVPQVGPIAVAVLGGLDETGERCMVLQLTPTDEGWAAIGLPKAMPRKMLDQLG